MNNLLRKVQNAESEDILDVAKQEKLHAFKKIKNNKVPRKDD